MHLGGTAEVVASEVRVAYHRYARLVVEESHGVGAQPCHVNEDILLRMTVDQSVGYVKHATLGVKDVHGGKVAVTWLYAYHLVGNLDGV